MSENTQLIPFRLYDFLAYLFPGIATLHALYLFIRCETPRIISDLLTGNVIADVIIALVLGYVIGLAWSVCGRELPRPLVWKFASPRTDFLAESQSQDSPFGGDLGATLRNRIASVTDGSSNPHQAHRLCHTLVSNRMPVSWHRRESIVGIRSMCANSIAPVLVYATAFFASGRAGTCIACTLTLKIIALDQRRWKEIYFAFLVATEPNLDHGTASGRGEQHA